MKKIFKSMALASLGLAILFSCTKNEPVAGTADGNGQMKLSVTAVLGEYKAAEGTKASLVNTPRVGWSGNETVHVFQQSDGTYLGSLTSSVKETGASVATLGGTISSGTGTLVFVYTNATMPSLTADDKYTNLEISLAEQGTDIPFVVYGTAESPGTGTVSGLVVNFSFATSVVSTYAAGLPASTAVTQATLSSINTKCVLTIPSSGDITVSGSTSGIITKSAGIGSTNAEGQVLFEIAVPVSEAASSGRSVEFTTGGKTCTAAFSGAAIESGKAYSAMSENHSVEAVVLGKASTTIFTGATETLTATVYPSSSTNKAVTWTSSNEAIATVNENGIITGQALGTAIITATSQEDPTITATCTVTVDNHEYVVIGGLKWAKMNIGATTVAGSTSTCYGDLYSWGETSTKTNYAKSYYSSTAKAISSDITPGSGNDVARVKWGGDWRMPTKEDFKKLYEACGGTNPPKSGGSASTTEKGVYWCSSYDGVAGLLFCDGAGHKLFFPAAGDSTSDSPSSGGILGYYWSSTWDSPDYAYSLGFSSATVISQVGYYRYHGTSVRPVSD